MRRFLFIFTALSIIFLPTFALASPGPLDQYGGHICQKDCQQYSLENGQYHFHDFPASLNYLAGDLPKTNENYVFFQPALEPFEITAMGDSFLVNESEPNTLVKGIGNDQYYCKDNVVFGGGLYDELNRARVLPVCAANENLVMADLKISPKSYYKEVSVENNIIKKVYHFEIRQNNQKIFTDFIPINELKGMIVKGETDSILYYVNRYDDPLSLRSVSPEKAAFYAGADYQTKIVNISDSLIYSYKIGQPLY